MAWGGADGLYCCADWEGGLSGYGSGVLSRLVLGPAIIRAHPSLGCV